MDSYFLSSRIISYALTVLSHKIRCVQMGVIYGGASYYDAPQKKVVI